MTISEFSRLTGIKTANLRFYDQIGLLSPERRGGNDYRYYSSSQLDMAYMIYTLREMNIGLEEIKKFAKERTPEKTITFFKRQDIRIQEEMERLRRTREIMQIYSAMAREGMKNENVKFAVTYKDKEPIFLGMEIPENQKDENSMNDFYNLATAGGLHLGYPLGAVVGRNPLNDSRFDRLLHYYFKVKHGNNAFKPEGLYATAYSHSPYGHSTEIYEDLLRFIGDNNFGIVGNVYEEYPFNEISVQDEQHYLVKLEIQIKEN